MCIWVVSRVEKLHAHFHRVEDAVCITIAPLRPMTTIVIAMITATIATTVISAGALVATVTLATGATAVHALRNYVELHRAIKAPGEEATSLTRAPKFAQLDCVKRAVKEHTTEILCFGESYPI